MKKKFRALMDYLRSLNPDQELKDGQKVGKLPRSFNPNGKRKGFYILNPNITPAQLQEVKHLVEEWKPHLVVEHRDQPRRDETTGKWFDPILSIAQPFKGQTEDELLDYGEDL